MCMGHHKGVNSRKVLQVPLGRMLLPYIECVVIVLDGAAPRLPSNPQWIKFRRSTTRSRTRVIRSYFQVSVYMTEWKQQCMQIRSYSNIHKMAATKMSVKTARISSLYAMLLHLQDDHASQKIFWWDYMKKKYIWNTMISLISYNLGEIPRICYVSKTLQ